MDCRSVASNVYESSNGLRYWTLTVPAGFKPYVGAKFQSLDEAIIMYEDYADQVSFCTHLSTTKVDKGITKMRYFCAQKRINQRIKMVSQL
ncbi:hypothetical protein HanRHA438_Chr10g0465891 [Helianthus annuus]|nr:hypothetical protein HanRHA438_Chr10g0465891 [Helianthus annuus]